MKKLLKLFVCALMVTSVLTGCSQKPANNTQNTSYTYAETIKWDAEYDVVVAGFGASGAVTAKTAADNGANVLIVEKMSEGEAGGNSKVAGQLLAYGHGDYDNTLSYYKSLAGETDVPDAMIETIAKGVTNMMDTLSTEFDIPFENLVDWTGHSFLGIMTPEYPEFESGKVVGMVTLHDGISDSFMYQTFKKSVADRAENIDVWFESPAVKLIQDPISNTIIGVQVERGGKTMNVRALNGVVLCTGGFEDDPEMVENYLGLTDYAAIGGLYNTGDGIKMAQEVGADLWHMHVYEGGFGLGGTSFDVEEGEHAVQIQSVAAGAYFTGPLNDGAVVLVGTDGDRFLNETELVRHGHLYENGTWRNPTYPSKMWVIYDETQAKEIMETNSIPERFLDTIVSANTIEELAELTGTKAEQLTATINQFNRYATNGIDEQHGRDPETMRAFDGAKYYAYPVVPEILNTQGGPKRNENAEILDTKGNPIPHLYSAGEMGGITSEMYQGGTNLAECVIFGQIAGKNAAAKKEALPEYTLDPMVESNPTHIGEVTDFNQKVEIETKENEYIGTANGMGGTLTVKVTMDGDKIAKVEVVSHAETDGIADPALEQIPVAIVDANSTDVDTISKATVTSKAIIDAVNNALSQIK